MPFFTEPLKLWFVKGDPLQNRTQFGAESKSSPIEGSWCTWRFGSNKLSCECLKSVGKQASRSWQAHF